MAMWATVNFIDQIIIMFYIMTYICCPMHRPERIIIADTYPPRANQVGGIARSLGIPFTSIIFDRDDHVNQLAYYRELVSDHLAQSRPIMTVCNEVAGIRLGVLQALFGLEVAHSFGSRRVMLSCYNPSQVQKRFRDHGLPKTKVRHVVYDDSNRHVQPFMDLF
ncbi:hypothetical protein IPJ72_01510 [Candidatus Peregrinibacteria bacterium]|nr:MAG: hypothetical protein IPJ72_01510 [Candidatus Peregrinibacteria bacterium]